MAWPQANEFQDAVLNPQLSFVDADLRDAEAVCDARGLPIPAAGQFGIVYQMRAADGKRWAVKFFTSAMPGRQERYRKISIHLQNARLPFTVGFGYLEQGVYVNEQWYPVLKMDWVEGQTLNQFVGKRVGNAGLLKALTEMWVKVAQMLADNQVTHADLQHGNVMLIPGKVEGRVSLKLVDYDGMYLPSLAGTKSGEVGHANYQHPHRLAQGYYGPEVDRFSQLVIYAALRAVAVMGRDLWQRYDNGDNLLFTQADFGAPAKSNVLKQLWKEGPPEIRHLTGRIVLTTSAPLSELPSLTDVLDGADVRPLTAEQSASVDRLLELTPAAPRRSESSRPLRFPKLSAAQANPSKDYTLIDLNDITIARDVIEFVPESVARENTVLPIANSDRVLKMAFCQGPELYDLVQKAQFILNREIEVVIAAREQLVAAIDHYYGQPEPGVDVGFIESRPPEQKQAPPPPTAGPTQTPGRPISEGYWRLHGDAQQNPVFRENLASFAQAYGLALQGLKRSVFKTNLLPTEESNWLGRLRDKLTRRLPSQTSAWGIDLGQAALKAMHLELDDDDNVSVTAFDYIEHPKILSQPDADPDQLAQEALQTFLSRNAIEGDTVCVGVPGYSGLMRFVKLPPHDAKKVKGSIEFEAKQQIPFALNEVVWDHQMLSGFTITNGMFLESEHAIVAMKRDMVNKVLANFKAVKLDVHVVQMAPLALVNYLAYDTLGKEPLDSGQEPEQRTECVALLDLGTDFSTLIVSNGTTIFWQRPIPMGGNHFTRALTKELKLTFAKAEYLKRNAAKSPELKMILTALKNVLADLTGEIQRSLGYFGNTHRGARIQHLVAVGNGFRLPGLQVYLQEKLQLPVHKLQ